MRTSSGISTCLQESRTIGRIPDAPAPLQAILGRTRIPKRECRARAGRAPARRHHHRRGRPHDRHCRRGAVRAGAVRAAVAAGGLRPRPRPAHRPAPLPGAGRGARSGRNRVHRHHHPEQAPPHRTRSRAGIGRTGPPTGGGTRRAARGRVRSRRGRRDRRRHRPRRCRPGRHHARPRRSPPRSDRDPDPRGPSLLGRVSGTLTIGHPE